MMGMDGVVGVITWKLARGERLSRREKRAVSRRMRLERRAARQLLDRHDRPGVYAFLDAHRAELPPLPADAPLGEVLRREQLGRARRTSWRGPSVAWQEFLSR